MKRIATIIAAVGVMSFGAVDAQAITKSTAQEKTRETALHLADIGSTWKASNINISVEGPYNSGVQWRGTFDLFRTGPGAQYCIGRMDIGRYGGVSDTRIHCANLQKN